MNKEAIIERIKLIVEHYGLSTSSFADSIQVQRSSMSHLLSGRNKPSLDFVTKVINTYPEVDLYWLLKGEGSFPKKKDAKQTPLSHTESQRLKTAAIKNQPPTLFETIATDEIQGSVKEFEKESKKTLCKVILLFSDGSFQEFNP